MSDAVLHGMDMGRVGGGGEGNDVCFAERQGLVYVYWPTKQMCISETWRTSPKGPCTYIV